MTTPRPWAAWPLLLASGVAFTQVVSFRALVGWVLVSVIATWWVTATLARVRGRLLGFLAGAATTLLASALTEALAGENDGPVTRTVLLASGLTVSMVLLLLTRWPLLAVLPGIALFTSALSLGGTGSSLGAAGVGAVAIAVTAAMVGPYRGAELRDRRHLAALGLSVVAIGLASVVATAATWRLVPFTGASADSETSTTSSVTDMPTEPPPAADASTTSTMSWLLAAVAVIALLLLTLLLLLALIALARRAWAALRWNLLHRRLRTGTPDDRIVGAWTWTRARRARHDDPLPVSASPDLVAAAAARDQDTELHALAQLVTQVAFDPHSTASMAESDRAWRAATAVGLPPPGASWRVRWAWARRTPS